MTGLADTLSRLAQLHRHYAGVFEAAETSGLAEIKDFGSNPGGLRMLTHVPAGLPAGAAMVVVLHGCAQTATGYDHGAGWSQLADRHGFAVLFPEQTRGNNANLCFNWFHPEDTARDEGEALSIRQMVDCMTADHRIDPARVFITGLSAGGAMAAAMLASYPEVFAGGAVIAGLPVGAASSTQGAIEAMLGGRSRPAPEWGDKVRAASPHRGPWPAVQIWQGGSDTTVKPSNAGELVKQWSDVQGLPATPTSIDIVDGAVHQAWKARDGHVALEVFMVPGLAHGAPLDTRSDDADHAGGAAGPYMLEGGISSTWHIAHAFGLLVTPSRRRTS
jgi:poly(hydroxyalkanoate) depolymerase family esterase